MKIVVAGTYRYSMYQDTLLYGLNCNGENGIKLCLPEDRPYNLMLPLKNAWRLFKYVKKERPDAVFLYRVENLLPIVVKILKKKYPNICFLMYHNDDPFRPGFKRRVKSYNYLHYVRYVDMVYVYRKVNIEEAKSWGGKMVKLFMSHYDSRHDLRELSHVDFQKKTDKVVYIGHCENDNRIEHLDYLFKNNINLHIYGPELWKKIFHTMGWPEERRHDRALGENYRNTIHEAAIALAFFSQANRDEYTRRCFEIPVMGTLIIAPRTSITVEIYKDGENAVLFDSKEDLLNKINYYNTHCEERDLIAENGFNHILNGDFSEISRARMVINDIKQWNDERNK